MNKSGKSLKIFDKVMECESAPDPSDIIWEN
jgi:hypothetical protein